MKKNQLNRILGFAVAVMMVIATLPSVAFAADAGENDVKIIFGATSKNHSTSIKPSDFDGSEVGYTVVPAESCTFQGDNRVNGCGEYKVQQVNFGASTRWQARKTASDKPNEAKFTFTVPIKKAGSYNVKLHGAIWYAAAGFYIYVNDEYAGFYNFDSFVYGSPYADGGEKSLNTLYLDPGTEGTAKIAIVLAKESTTYGQDRAQLIGFSLDYVGEKEVTYSDIEHTIPSEIEYGKTVEFTANAVMSDGSARHSNKYEVAADGTAVISDKNSMSAAVSSGTSVHLENTFNDELYDGVYSGILSATEFGETTVTLTAMIDGVPKTKEVVVNVVEPKEASTVTVDMRQTGLKYTDKTSPSDSTWIATGYKIITEKSSTYGSRNMGGHNHILTRSGKYITWPNKSATETDLMFTVSTIIPKAGNYDVYMQGYSYYAGSQYAVYVNGEYVGDYSFWDGDTTQTSELKQADRMKLNNIELPRGNVEISFRLRKVHYDEPRMVSPVLELVPASAPEISAIENKAVISGVETAITPELLSQIKVGDVINAKSRVKMSDGSYRHFGYTDSGALPTEDNVVSVKSSNPDVVEVSDVVCVEAATSTAATITQVIDPTTTTYKLTAKNGGCADITVTAIVDGKTKTSTTTIEVPFADGSEVIKDKMVNFSALSETGGSVTPSDVREVKIGNTVTVEATANDGYQFSHWRNAAGAWLSDNAKENFTVNTNTAVVAVYDKISKEETTGVPLRFYNGNGELLENKNVEKGTSFGDAKIDSPTLVGAIFKKWSLDDSAVINAPGRAVALYDDDMASTYSVTVDGKTAASGIYGTKVSVMGGDNFVCWKLGDNVVSHDKKYEFLIWGNIELTEVTEGESLTAPTVGIDKQGNNYFITYNVPEDGYTFVEAGIIFGTSEDISINSTDGSKAIAKKKTGYFTAKPAKAAHNVARGYVIFMDESDNVRVIYAD